MQLVQDNRDLKGDLKSQVSGLIKFLISCLCLSYAQEDQREFAKLVDTFKAQYNDGPRVQWGGHILGPKSQHKLKKRERAIAKELAQRNK